MLLVDFYLYRDSQILVCVVYLTPPLNHYVLRDALFPVRLTWVLKRLEVIIRLHGFWLLFRM
jgi:hypothetical protein